MCVCLLIFAYSVGSFGTILLLNGWSYRLETFTTCSYLLWGVQNVGFFQFPPGVKGKMGEFPELSRLSVGIILLLNGWSYGPETFTTCFYPLWGVQNVFSISLRGKTGNSLKFASFLVATMRYSSLTADRTDLKLSELVYNLRGVCRTLELFIIFKGVGGKTTNSPNLCRFRLA